MTWSVSNRSIKIGFDWIIKHLLCYFRFIKNKNYFIFKHTCHNFWKKERGKNYKLRFFHWKCLMFSSNFLFNCRLKEIYQKWERIRKSQNVIKPCSVTWSVSNRNIKIGVEWIIKIHYAISKLLKIKNYFVLKHTCHNFWKRERVRENI